MIFKPTTKPVTGSVKVPGDKSISHRALMFGGISEGITVINNFLPGQDCLSTLEAMRLMGVKVKQEAGQVIVEGQGTHGLKEPEAVINVGNSGTTARLLIGLLSGQPFHSVLSGDASLVRRPMDRVTIPLTKMGASFRGRKEGRFAPLSIQGKALTGFEYHSPVASGQVKSALLLAGLYSDGETTVVEPHPSRDHTERMIRAFGGEVHTDPTGTIHKIKGKQTLHGQEVTVPGDISSAAFLMALTQLKSESELTIEAVGINPTRTGFLDVLTEMGVALQIENERQMNGEPVADITVSHSSLKGVTVGGKQIPRLIDEIPILALIAAVAEGKTTIKDAAELKVKETNRIHAVVTTLTQMGVAIEETSDGFIIEGNPELVFKGGQYDTYGDHRMAMMAAVASFNANEPITLNDADVIDVSFPGFIDLLKTVG